MKRISTLFVTIVMFAMCITAAVHKPILVGHRGSYWGLENSEEAFINGAKKGYEYLETDVKVTKDGKHVCCHNDDLTTWGGTLTIASNTLEALQAETLSQTRGGVKYTGHLCSLEEYLDICAQYNVKPLIELKWATGINSNDCSGIPNLIKVIESKGFRSTCIILTSMKPCLQYIKNNYPDIKLQYLCYSSSFASSFEWCKTWGIGIDSATGSEINRDAVKKYQDAGLPVNVWTVNNNTNYSIYGGYGCDYITTDYLEPSSLPEIVLEEESVVKVEVVWEKSTTLGNAPENIDGIYALQGGGHDQKFYVHNHNEQKLYIFDKTGCLGSIPGTYGRGCAIDDAGNIILRTDSLHETSHSFMVYPAGATVEKPGTPVHINVTVPVGGQSNVFSASGNVLGDGGYIYTYPAGNTAVNVIAVANGAVTETKQSGALSLEGTVEGYVIPKNNNPEEWIYQIRAKGYYTYTKGANAELLTGSFSASAPNRNTTIGGAYITLGEKEIFLHNSGPHYKGGFTVRDLSLGTVVDNIDPIGSLGYVDGGNKTCGNWINIERIDEYSCYIYQYCPANGMAVYKMYDSSAGEEPTPSEEVEFVFEEVWEKSTTLGNAPSNIHGTNAQQGAGHDGHFYVNNCVEKKLHIFGNDAQYLGSVAGGSGWGCDCDDAGNIVIRNDKDTGTEHKFIIYPAGTTVANPGTPVELDVTIPLTGQTNFISASGNVLGKEGGYIYMFPNSQTAVCVITMVEGKVTATNSYTGLAIKGSTAGYVIPMENNPEKWIYQVRSDGYYQFNNGTSKAYMSGSASTTQPARNSSVGGEYLVLSGHEIFMHSSGANYKGGFTVRDMTEDKVIKNIEPIGTLGYTTGGNYSVSNWVRAEKIDDHSCYIYQYCPANGLAVYKLYNKNAVVTGVENIKVAKNTSIKVYPNPAVSNVTVTASQDITDIALFNLAGAQVDANASVDGNQAILNVKNLPSGIYIVKANNQSTKLIKK